VNGGPDWVIPAITASASLLGTIVGGLAAYWTSKKTHDRQTAAEEERQKYTLLREAAIRFVTAMTDISVANLGIKEISREWGAVADQLASARTEQDLIDIAKQVDPTIQPGLSRINTLLRLVRLTGLPEEDLKKAVTLLTELRFIAPSDVADSAQRVIYTAFAQELTAAIAPHLRHQTTDAFNREINDFVNRVRHHMHFEHYEFKVIDQQTVQDILNLDDVR
jgi:hypothetical protein